MPMKEPSSSSYFRLSLGGKENVGVFKEASGFDSETEVIEHQSIDGQGHSVKRKIAGLTKWSDVTLKRGVDDKLDLWKWRDTVIKEGAEKARVDAKIELLDMSGKAIATYQLKQAWPSSYKGATLDASTNNVALEELVLVHEGMERV